MVYSETFVNVYAVQKIIIFWDNVLVETYKKWQKCVSKMKILTKIISSFGFDFVYWLIMTDFIYFKTVLFMASDVYWIAQLSWLLNGTRLQLDPLSE